MKGLGLHGIEGGAQGEYLLYPHQKASGGGGGQVVLGSSGHWTSSVTIWAKWMYNTQAGKGQGRLINVDTPFQVPFENLETRAEEQTASISANSAPRLYGTYARYGINVANVWFDPRWKGGSITATAVLSITGKHQGTGYTQTSLKYENLPGRALLMGLEPPNPTWIMLP
jgi:hypothetical protein